MFKKRIKIWTAVIFMMIAGICYSCKRAQDRPPEAELLIAETNPPSETAGELQPETTPAVLCYVHICGAVERPGVYEMEEGSRVFQAVERAGGFSAEAARDYLNMADSVTDGMKLVVPAQEELEAWESYGQASAEQSSAKVNINTADKTALMTLRGIGESRAEDIIRYREKSGGFQKIEDIMNVSGIKDAAFEKIKDDIQV